MQKKECTQDRSGDRHADKCNVTSNAVGDIWAGGASNARKIYLNKPAGDNGEERIKIWQSDTIVIDRIVEPGFNEHLLKSESGRSVKIEVTTTKVGSNGTSSYYIHLEWFS
ncbi:MULTISPECIES: hypothetical protein [Olivibacter]|uniref:Uncharacterized protein n=1 Tax=Olivibacter jilunii TaxID=985016 RepID=A0ABW6B2G9_9SPHI